MLTLFSGSSMSSLSFLKDLLRRSFLLDCKKFHRWSKLWFDSHLNTALESWISGRESYRRVFSVSNYRLKFQNTRQDSVIAEPNANCSAKFLVQLLIFILHFTYQSTNIIVGLIQVSIASDPIHDSWRGASQWANNTDNQR